MPHWLVVTLLIVFVAHFVVILALAFKRHDSYYALVSFTFLLLVIAYALRLGVADWSIAGIKTYWYFRIAAWSMACVSIYSTIRRRRRFKKTIQAP